MRIALVLAALVAAPFVARADDTQQIRLERGPRGDKRYVFLKPLEVRAHVPQALILLNRSNVGYDDPALGLEMTPRIHQATTHDPF